MRKRPPKSIPITAVLIYDAEKSESSSRRSMCRMVASLPDGAPHTLARRAQDTLERRKVCERRQARGKWNRSLIDAAVTLSKASLAGEGKVFAGSDEEAGAILLAPPGG